MENIVICANGMVEHSPTTLALSDRGYEMLLTNAELELARRILDGEVETT